MLIPMFIVTIVQCLVFCRWVIKALPCRGHQTQQFWIVWLDTRLLYLGFIYYCLQCSCLPFVICQVPPRIYQSTGPMKCTAHVSPTCISWIFQALRETQKSSVWETAPNRGPPAEYRQEWSYSQQESNLQDNIWRRATPVLKSSHWLSFKRTCFC